MTRSTAATRAARRAFWTHPALYSLGRLLDRSRPVFVALTVWAVVVTFAVLGSLQDFPLPSSPAAVAPQSTQTFVPCVHEESSYCYWDARARGNGEGRSFIALGDSEPHIFLGPIPAPTPVIVPAPIPVETTPVETAPIVVPVVPAKPLPTITVTGHAVEPVKPPVAASSPVVVPTPSATPVNGSCAELKLGDGGTTQQHNCTTPSPTPHCPPLLHKDGVSVTPPNAPKDCVYAQ